MKRSTLLMSVVVVLLFCSSPQAYSLSRASKELSKIRQQEPTFSDVVKEAFKKEKLGLHQIDIWKKRMKTAPWLPKLYVGYDRTLRETNGISISDNVSVSSSGIAIGPVESDLDQTLVNGDAIKFRAVWELDQLVFHKSTLSASREKRELVKTRLSLSDYLFKVYLERRALQSQYFLLKGTGNKKQLIIREKIEALTEKLDLFTARTFTNQWWREK